MLIDQFGGKCQRCGYDRSHRALHFHHIDGSEKYQWNASGRLSHEEVATHPERFALLCANCHAEEHERLVMEAADVRSCPVCGTTFRVKESRLRHGRGKFCSRRCAGEGQSTTARSHLSITDEYKSRVVKRAGCWGWSGMTSNGKPVVKALQENGRWTNRSAQRVSYELHIGAIPRGKKVTPTCGSPLCTNPDHLLAGTQRDVMALASAQGKTTRGEKSASHKLTEDQVREIRARYATGAVKQSELAKEFGLHQVTVSQIVLRKRWPHLD